jgi:hypothetical protein
MKDLTITLEDRSGRLAYLGEATGKAGINIEGLRATTGGGRPKSTSWSTTTRLPARP